MKRVVVALAAVGLALIATPPVQAAEARATTATTFTVQPGAQRTVFHDGDPVRLCFAARTGRAVDKPVVVSIDQRQGVEGAKWKSVQEWRVHPNHTACVITAVHVDGRDDPDLLLRARTIRGPAVDWSVSPVRRLDLGAPN